MNEENEIVASSLGTAVVALVEASGVTGPPKEVLGFITAFIAPRREVFAAKQLQRAAEKARASGLAPGAISDKLLRNLVEHGSMEDEPGMQELWANLLANAVVDGRTRVRAEFPQILSELNPEDAQLLNVAAERMRTEGQTGPLQLRGSAADYLILGNLERLGLIAGTIPGPVQIVEVRPTALGQAFVLACTQPTAMND